MTKYILALDRQAQKQADQGELEQHLNSFLTELCATEEVSLLGKNPTDAPRRAAVQYNGSLLQHIADKGYTKHPAIIIEEEILHRT